MDKLTIEVDAKTIYDSLSDLGSKMEEMIRHQKHTNGTVRENSESIQRNSDKINVLEKFKIKSAAFIAGVVAVVQVMLSYFPQIKFLN